MKPFHSSVVQHIPTKFIEMSDGVLDLKSIQIEIMMKWVGYCILIKAFFKVLVCITEY